MQGETVNLSPMTPSADRVKRQAYYDRIAKHNLAPLWESLSTLVSEKPNTPAEPARWSYDQTVRAPLMEAGELITAEEAERRVLILENPGLPGTASITHSLYAGVQLVLPGEVAPAHRHTQNALRFVLEGKGAHTAVNGERTAMYPGDLVITPAWTWHDHGNETDTPMVWLDGLDIPMVSFFDASFAEKFDTAVQAETRPQGDSPARYGRNLAPVDWQPESPASPIFNYPYSETRETLATFATNDVPDPCHGHKLRYVNPADGGHVTPTMAAFMQLLPVGFKSTPYRSTDASVVSVVEGTGTAIIGNQTYTFAPRDILVVPSWTSVTWHAASETILFSFSDRAAQTKLNLWREDRAGQ
ncbi:MAG: gentisate 1,2-dioxygenase [Henriciella sp.]|nr:gentisate 1,2-dioxygenase [Henriciella sp.]